MFEVVLMYVGDVPKMMITGDVRKRAVVRCFVGASLQVLFHT